MIVTLSEDYQYKKVLFGTNNCHCSRIVTLTGETVTDRACIDTKGRVALGSSISILILLDAELGLGVLDLGEGGLELVLVLLHPVLLLLPLGLWHV